MNLLALDRLPIELREAIATRRLVPGQILFRQGDLATALFVVETGRLKLFRQSLEQRSITLQIARSGESCGETALFSEVHSYSTVAEIVSQVVVYPKQSLLLALHQYPQLTEDLMRRLVVSNLTLITQLELRDIRAAHRRVLQYLRYLTSAEQTNFVNFDRPLKEVATDLGLTPATLSRVLTRLEREGAITREQNVIWLQNSAIT